MKQTLFKLIAKSLTSLLEKSIKDENILIFVLTLLTHLINIVDLLTDDDKDNTIQVKIYVKENLDSFITSLIALRDSKNLA